MFLRLTLETKENLTASTVLLSVERHTLSHPRRDANRKWRQRKPQDTSQVLDPNKDRVLQKQQLV